MRATRTLHLKTDSTQRRALKRGPPVRAHLRAGGEGLGLFAEAEAKGNAAKGPGHLSASLCQKQKHRGQPPGAS